MSGEPIELNHGRFGAVDLAKLVAAAAVVWIHVVNSAGAEELLPLCRFAVPFFTCAAVYFLLRKISSEEIPLRSYCLERGRRLYLPFLWWSGIYFAARVVKHATTGHGSHIVLSPALFLNGTAHHLWFLPFICLVSVLTFLLVRCLGTPSHGRECWWAVTCLSIGTFLAFVPCPILLETTRFPLSYFIDHAWDMLPAAFFGAALFWIFRFFKPGAASRIVVLLLGLACVLWEFVRGVSQIAPHVTGASLLFFTCTQENRSWMKSVVPWAQLAFLIYLVHVLYVEALQVMASRYGTVRSLSADLSVWALSLVVSAITAKMMLRSRHFSWAFPR